MWDIILAVILGLPALIVSTVSSLLVGILSIPSMWLLRFRAKQSNVTSMTKQKHQQQQRRRHAIITGGSSGIGYAIAKECLGKMDRITLLARNEAKLLQCQRELEAATKGTPNSMKKQTQIQIVSVDVTNAAALQRIAASICIRKAVSSQDVNDHDDDDDDDDDDNGVFEHYVDHEQTFLFCCAGTAIPGRFQELAPETFANQMQTNYLGTVYTIHAFLPYMMMTMMRPSEKNTKGNGSCSAGGGGGGGGGGTIVLTSSAAGQVGVYGYTAYAPSKFALRGFAESLHMELVQQKKNSSRSNRKNNINNNNNNVHIQLVYPPDTDTPGFETENQHKPEETKLISDTLTLMAPQQVAQRMVQEATASNPKFQVNFGVEGWMLSTVTGGMSPENNWMDAIAQVSLMGLLRFISFVYLNDFWRILRTYVHDDDNKQQQQQHSSTSLSEPISNKDTEYGTIAVGAAPM